MTTDTQDSMKILQQQLAQSIRSRLARIATIKAEAEATPDAEASPANHVNSTDATRGEPLLQRAQKRKAELAALLDALSEDAIRARGEIDTAIATVDDLLTGDNEHLSNMTAVALNRWLETNKHLAEMAS